MTSISHAPHRATTRRRPQEQRARAAAAPATHGHAATSLFVIERNPRPPAADHVQTDEHPGRALLMSEAIDQLVEEFGGEDAILASIPYE